VKLIGGKRRQSASAVRSDIGIALLQQRGADGSAARRGGFSAGFKPRADS